MQVDAPIAVTPGDTEHMDVEVRYRGKVVPDPHVVLIRIDNAGGLDIEPRHIQKKLEFAFPDRKIVGLDVTGASPASLGQILEERLASDNFIETSRLVVPRVAINRGESFKFLLVLSGKGQGVDHSGHLVGGSAGGGVYHEPRSRGPGRRTLIFGSLSLLLVGALVALVVVDVLRPPDNCASGQLRLIGSTAVEPVVKEVRSGQIIAMTDGKVEEQLDLQGQPIAVVLFAVVVHRSAGVTSLTTAQVREIYAGRITNWDRVGGRSMPIRMVSRVGPDSGTRRVFRDQVLGGGQELGITSDDCRQKDPGAVHHRCEVGTSEEVLNRVNDIDGAIGYAGLGLARKHTGLTVVELDGIAPGTAQIAAGDYKFWEVEYAYTYRVPEPDSLQEAFLDYLRSAGARTILAREGLIPCADLRSGRCE